MRLTKAGVRLGVCVACKMRPQEPSLDVTTYVTYLLLTLACTMRPQEPSFHWMSAFLRTPLPSRIVRMRRADARLVT